MVIYVLQTVTCDVKLQHIAILIEKQYKKMANGGKLQAKKQIENTKKNNECKKW